MAARTNEDLYNVNDPMSTLPKSQPISRSIIERLLLGAAPERRDDIENLWQAFYPQFHVAKDDRNIRLSANANRVVFDHKSMAVYWLLSFVSWRALQAYVPAAFSSLLFDITVSQVLQGDSELSEFEGHFYEGLYVAQSIVKSDELLASDWPPDVPHPGADRAALSDDTERALFDLACISASYAFCHEIRHITLAKEQATPTSRSDEELACDIWAREFLTAKAGEYCKTSGEAYAAVLSKRSMGAAVGMFVLCETTDRSTGEHEPNYPMLAERLDATLGNTPLADWDRFWFLYASILIAIARRNKANLDIRGQSPRQLCGLLVEQIRFLDIQ